MMIKDDLSVGGNILLMLTEFASKTGLDIEKARVACNLHKRFLSPPVSRVPIIPFQSFWRALEDQSADPSFGIHFTEYSHRLAERDLILVMMLNCSTVGNALRLLARYHHYYSDFVQLQIDPSESSVALDYIPADVTLRMSHHLEEAMIAALILSIRLMSQGKIKVLETRFRHSKPLNISEHNRVFSSPLRFNQPNSGVSIKADDFNLPIFLSNQQVLEGVENLVLDIEESQRKSETIASQTTRLIQSLLQNGQKPSLKDIATKFHRNDRSLQKLLSAEGTSFRELLNQARKKVALKYLETSDMSIGEIAFMLGYDEQSSFHHAFKKWTGQSPGFYRS